MATGQVTSFADENWVLVSTQAVTAAANATFSSLAGYKKYIVTYNTATTSASASLNMTLNGATTNYSATIDNGTANTNSVTAILTTRAANTTFYPTYIRIENPLQAIPKVITGLNVEGVINAMWGSTAAVTSIALTPSAGTVTGTFNLYGLAA